MARRRVPIRQSELVQRFAARLREVRQARGMTQTDLASQASVTASYLSRLEGGRVAPGIDMVERIAEALGTTVADLLPDGAAPDPLPILRQQARRLLESLTRDGAAEDFLRLNPVLALVQEAAMRRG
jgi:transcriptional regulator with XRE-family HTH domain